MEQHNWKGEANDPSSTSQCNGDEFLNPTEGEKKVNQKRISLGESLRKIALEEKRKGKKQPYDKDRRKPATHQLICNRRHKTTRNAAEAQKQERVNQCCVVDHSW